MTRRPWWSRALRQVARHIWLGLIAIGPALGSAPALTRDLMCPPPVRRLAGPPDGHLERLCTEQPLSDVEAALDRQLRDIDVTLKGES